MKTVNRLMQCSDCKCSGEKTLLKTFGSRRLCISCFVETVRLLMGDFIDGKMVLQPQKMIEAQHAFLGGI